MLHDYMIPLSKEIQPLRDPMKQNMGGDYGLLSSLWLYFYFPESTVRSILKSADS